MQTTYVSPPAAQTWDWSALRAACSREARRLIFDPHDAEEAAQEAIFRAWRHQGSCRNPRDPMPWVVHIARMEALRVLDKRQTRRARETHDEHEERLALVEQPRVDEVVLRLDVDSALATLGPADRALVHARYVDDLPQSEVARRLQVPEGTAKVRLHRVRNRLRAALAQAA
jgi:RNA polymerase sigma-70 factor (ECF subfamily)